MSANTILLDFSIDPQVLIEKGIGKFEKDIINSLETYIGIGTLIRILCQTKIPSDTNLDIMSMYIGPRGCTVTIRFFTKIGLVTINLDYYKKEGETPLLGLEECSKIEKILSKEAELVKKVRTIPAIRRGIPFDTYFITEDGRLNEYDIDSVIYDEHSEFQHIQILHSASFGNMLVLDNDQNMAVSDLIYTESIMRRGQEYYKNKDILILGGGDGGLLNELLKEKPRMVIMAEIDEMVIKACQKYLRDVCGDVFDNYRGENYEIILGDCVNFLDKCKIEKRKFDYIFYDLTALPISTAPEEMEIWKFITKILNMSFEILKIDGKYMSQGHGMTCKVSKEMFTKLLLQLKESVQMDIINVFVPSFMEGWTFYRIQRQ